MEFYCWSSSQLKDPYKDKSDLNELSYRDLQWTGVTVTDMGRQRRCITCPECLTCDWELAEVTFLPPFPTSPLHF